MKVHGSAAVEQLTWCKEGIEGNFEPALWRRKLGWKTSFFRCAFCARSTERVGDKDVRQWSVTVENGRDHNDDE